MTASEMTSSNKEPAIVTPSGETSSAAADNAPKIEAPDARANLPREKAAPSKGALALHVEKKSAPPLPPPTLAGRIRAYVEEHGYRAAGIAIALGCGWIAGANTFDNSAPSENVVVALRTLDAKIDAVAARTHDASDLAGLRHGAEQTKTALDATRNNTAAAVAQLTAKLDRLDRDHSARHEKFEKENTSRIDRLTERLDRMERQIASPATTASIPAPALPATVASRLPERAKVPANGYVLREVRGNAAIVENHAGLIEVSPGDNLPGAGRVRAIERRGREWVVVTSGGLIDSNGY